MVRDDRTDVHRDLVARLREGGGQASSELRRSAFDNAGVPDGVRELVEAVALNPPAVTGESFAAAQAAGLSQDQVWEVVICAAVGQASRQYEAGLAALASALDQQGEP